MRDCPTVEGSSAPLIIHRIAAADCLARQGCNYHKCHRCLYRGKPATWQPDGLLRRADGAAPRALTGERAVPTHTVEVPRPAEVPATAPATERKPRRRGKRAAQV
jgi:hypothetical protein